MGIIEGFATFALETDIEEDEYDYQIQFFVLVVAIKLLMIYVISRFIWPRVMPAISSSIICVSCCLVVFTPKGVIRSIGALWTSTNNTLSRLNVS